jgi:peptide chain release factor 2
LKLSGGRFDWDNSLKRLEELKVLCEAPDLWQDNAKASSLLKERTFLENSLNNYKEAKQNLEDAVELIKLAEVENDIETLNESEKDLEKLAKKLKNKVVECLLSGEADSNDCFIEIHAGAGGTESQDWAAMLLRMYLRWAERHEFQAEIIDEHAGDEAGIKSATIKICGHNCYGWARTESGVHRLVRISPFDSNARRHTSFASVWVYPIVDDTIEIVIDEKDLRIDTFRASGAGGQHINKTDSAIRITHLPTNIVVQCQNSRSQHRNRAEAYQMLRSRLYELELQKKEQEQNAANETKKEIGWGHQIRSYVLHPYQMVKDLRSGFQTSNTAGVLDGEIDEMINASLSGAFGV